MMLKVKQKLMDEEGMTLVELLAAIVILSIIVISFLGFFTQSAQTNNRTNSVNEATFLAQEEIERITYCSQNDFTIAETLAEKPGNIAVSITADSSTDLYKVVVSVNKGGEARAKMETYLPFPAEDGE